MRDNSLDARLDLAVCAVEAAMKEVGGICDSEGRESPRKYMAGRIWNDLNRIAAELRETRRSITVALPALQKTL